MVGGFRSDSGGGTTTLSLEQESGTLTEYPVLIPRLSVSRAKAHRNATTPIYSLTVLTTDLSQGLTVLKD